MSSKSDCEHCDRALSHKVKKRDFTDKCNSKKAGSRAGLESQKKIISEAPIRLLLKSSKSPLLKQATKHKRNRLSPDASHFESIINCEVTAAMTTQVDRISESELAVIYSLISAQLKKKKKVLLPVSDSSNKESVIIAVSLMQAEISKFNKLIKIITLKNEVSKYTTKMLYKKVEKELKTNKKLIDVFIQSMYKGNKSSLINISEKCNLESNKFDYLKLHNTQVIKIRVHAREKQEIDSLLFLVSVHVLIK